MVSDPRTGDKAVVGSRSEDIGGVGAVELFMNKDIANISGNEWKGKLLAGYAADSDAADMTRKAFLRIENRYVYLWFHSKGHSIGRVSVISTVQMLQNIRVLMIGPATIL